MNYDFPDVEAGLLEVIPKSTLWLGKDDLNFDDEAPAGTSVVHHIYTVGGSELGPLRTDRVTIDTYAPSRDEAKAAAEAERARLTSGPHETSEGLLDHVEVEVVPRSIPYPDDAVAQFQATYRIDTRPI